MRLGASLVHFADEPPYEPAAWACRLAGAGFDSLWTSHLVGRGALVPDPFVVLAAAAAVTEGVELGTGTVQVPLYHPAELAFRVLSLQVVCGARLSLGVSPGSTAADFASLDRDFSSRFAVLHSHVARLRGLLADGGDERAVLAPPDLVSRPPLLLGSWGANVERAARDYDGWIASGVRRTPDEILAALARYRAAGGARAVVGAIPVEDDLGRARDVLARYAEAGFDDAVVVIGPGGPEPERVRALLD